MELTDTEFEEANRRAAEMRSAFPTVDTVRYDHSIERIVVTFASGVHIGFPPGVVVGLETAGPDDFEGAEISPSGLGVHFPKIDADIYLPALLEDLLRAKGWFAPPMEESGKQALKDAKTIAAQTNGQLGGRPPKTPKSFS
jgi:hypothetical protein